MSNETYSLGFTSGATLLDLSGIVARTYLKLGSWPEVKSHVLFNNLFQTRTTSTSKKFFSEISKRLKRLSMDELQLLAVGKDTQRQAIAWLAICRYYRLVQDFTLEVVVPKYESTDFLITPNDYDIFFQSKADQHPNLERVSRHTAVKARQVIFKMMRECNLIDTNGLIVPQLLDNELITCIGDDLISKSLFPGAMR